MPNLSLIIPVKNEAENLPLLYTAIKQALKPIKQSWEVIFVDDGSTDPSLDVLQSLVNEDLECIRVVVFRRNFGQTAAISAGIDYAYGEIIVLMDADLQNDPADIPRLLEKLDEGYDLVSGWRKERKDNQFTRTFPSKIAKFSRVVTNREFRYPRADRMREHRDKAVHLTIQSEPSQYIPAVGFKCTTVVMEMNARHP